jgi:hypothetical protein
MEKCEYIVSERRRNGRFICLNKYLYRKRKTVGEKEYYYCFLDKCRASLLLCLGEIPNINENHTHRNTHAQCTLGDSISRSRKLGVLSDIEILISIGTISRCENT